MIGHEFFSRQNPAYRLVFVHDLEFYIGIWGSWLYVYDCCDDFGFCDVFVFVS